MEGMEGGIAGTAFAVHAFSDVKTWNTGDCLEIRVKLFNYSFSSATASVAYRGYYVKALIRPCLRPTHSKLEYMFEPLPFLHSRLSRLSPLHKAFCIYF